MTFRPSPIRKIFVNKFAKVSFLAQVLEPLLLLVDEVDGRLNSLALLDRLLALGRRVADLGDDLLAQLRDAGAHLVVGELLHGGFEAVNLRDERLKRLDVALVAAAENFGQKFIYHLL